MDTDYTNCDNEPVCGVCGNHAVDSFGVGECGCVGVYVCAERESGRDCDIWAV